jgi:uncharacterized membrane protein YfcA
MVFSWTQEALAVLSGGAVGFSLGLIGGGGSILAVPLLLYVVGIGDAHVAIGTSALAVAANAFANLLSHWRAAMSNGLAPRPSLLLAYWALRLVRRLESWSMVNSCCSSSHLR